MSVKEIDPEVYEVLFDTVLSYARFPDIRGVLARQKLLFLQRQHAMHFDMLRCVHCERAAVVLRQRYDGNYVCEDAQSCFRELREPDAIGGVMIAVRQYQRNSVISYWDGRDMPCSIEEYIQKEKPTIYARIPNDEMSEARWYQIIEDIKKILLLDETIAAPDPAQRRRHESDNI